MMRKWRVGTLSMGVTLILTGTVLMLSISRVLSSFDMLMAWWPLMFVLLGAELLVYLFVARKENPVIHYDILSIGFVLVLSAVCLVYALFASTGLLQAVRERIGAVQQTIALPEVARPLPNEVKTVVVLSNGCRTRIEHTSTDQLHLLGSVTRAQTGGGTTVAMADYASMQTIGDKMFVTLTPPPYKTGLGENPPLVDITIVVPPGVTVNEQSDS